MPVKGSMNMLFRVIVILGISLTLACDKKEGYSNPNRNLKKHIFDDERLEIGLPHTWRVENNIIYGPKNNLKGEIAPGIITTRGAITGSEFLTRLQNRGPNIPGESQSYNFPANSVVIEMDSVMAGGREWYVAQTITEFDGPKNRGTWFTHYYITLKDNRLLFINFYTQHGGSLDKSFYKDILATVRELD